MQFEVLSLREQVCHEGLFKFVKCAILNTWQELNEQKRKTANDNARGSEDANLFLDTPYLGHLGLHPSGFER